MVYRKTLGAHWHFWHIIYAIAPATALWFYAEYREPRVRDEYVGSVLSRPNNPKDLTNTAWKVRKLEETVDSLRQSQKEQIHQNEQRKGQEEVEGGEQKEQRDVDYVKQRLERVEATLDQLKQLLVRARDGSSARDDTTDTEETTEDRGE